MDVKTDAGWQWVPQLLSCSNSKKKLEHWEAVILRTLAPLFKAIQAFYRKLHVSSASICLQCRHQTQKTATIMLKKGSGLTLRTDNRSRDSAFRPEIGLHIGQQRNAFMCVCVCVYVCMYVCIYIYIYIYIYICVGARGSAAGWGTALQVGRSRVRFPVVSLEFFIDIILPAMALGSTQPLT